MLPVRWAGVVVHRARFLPGLLGRQRFYAVGWLISVGVMLVTFRMWQLHVREVAGRQERRRSGARPANEERDAEGRRSYC